jgi:hypothetical protein
MARRTRCLTAGTVLLALLMPSAALAADPGTVTVRVEGDADTLLVRTVVPASGAALVRDGNTCPGDSAAAALDRASGGSWAGTWNPSFSDWELTTIKGESHSFSAAAYWGFFLDEAVANAGICTQKVQAGDRLLFAPAPSNFDPVGVLTLDGVPATIAPGTPFKVTVKRAATTYGGPPDFLPITENVPLAGATIALPAGGTATTGADGTAAITLATGGPVSLRATHTGDVRSAAESVCATTGTDGLCGSVRPSAATSGATATARDTTPPLARIARLREGQKFKRGKAPRTLSGSVAVDGSGLKDVELRITRRSGKRCEAYDGGGESWVRPQLCGTEGGRFFSIGNRADWSYLLPAALTPGRYVLDIRTIDNAGNVTRGADRAKDPSKPRTRVVFTVG